ncbi:hypothetical protein [Metamycoplasma buccale]|uniref:hypothetical protein n=1 Tax=Metamycoplasma buccale TaxID=55602 RepID=UPI00398F366E
MCVSCFDNRWEILDELLKANIATFKIKEIEINDKNKNFFSKNDVLVKIDTIANILEYQKNHPEIHAAIINFNENKMDAKVIALFLPWKYLNQWKLTKDNIDISKEWGNRYLQLFLNKATTYTLSTSWRKNEISWHSLLRFSSKKKVNEKLEFILA